MTRLVAIALVLAAAGSAAAGDPAPGSDPRRRAAEAFRAAERAFADEDYPEALQLFRLALELAPDDAVRFNLAVCLERLGRFREAAAEYEAVAASARLAADVRARARTEAAHMRARLGRLVIAGRPTGASVRVDGAASCSLPCQLDVDPGRHDIVAETAGATDSRTIEIARGATVTVTLDASPPPPLRRGPGALTWAGSGVAALGTGAAIYFGLRAQALHGDYLAMPTPATRDDGLRMKDLTNISIGVAATAALVVVIDLLVLARRPADEPRRIRATTAKLHPGALIELAF